MLPKSYKKLIVRKIGSNPRECLDLIEVPLKKLHSHEVMVKNHYTGINSTDVARMMGLDASNRPLPFDLGAVAIGEVIAVGDKVDDYQAGDTVATVFPGNGYSNYSIVDHNFVGKIPAIDPKYIGLFISGTIAKIALEFVADIQANETVLVTSGAGASGHYAVQLAKAQGCHVVAICGSVEEVVLLKQLGVDRVINRNEEDILHIIANDYHDMINVVFDNLGGYVLDACIEHSAPRARIILAEALREHLQGEASQHSIDLFRKVIIRSVSLIGFNLGDYANAVPMESMKLIDKLQAGFIQSIVDPTSFEGIDSIPDAIAHLMSGESHGKIVVKL